MAVKWEHEWNWLLHSLYFLCAQNKRFSNIILYFEVENDVKMTLEWRLMCMRCCAKKLNPIIYHLLVFFTMDDLWTIILAQMFAAKLRCAKNILILRATLCILYRHPSSSNFWNLGSNDSSHVQFWLLVRRSNYLR